MFVLETEKLSKDYDGNLAITEVSLKVKEGDIFGLLGESGSGKSTFINIVTDVTKPTSGCFKLFGKEKINNKIKKEISILPSYPFFYDNLTPLQHLKFFSGIMGVKKNKQDLISLLNKVELREVIDIELRKLSPEMKKKFGLAQVLVNDPKLIFLDDPMCSLDLPSAKSIENLIKKICRTGKTILLTSSKPSELVGICNQIAIIKRGDIQSEISINLNRDVEIIY